MMPVEIICNGTTTNHCIIIIIIILIIIYWLNKKSVFSYLIRFTRKGFIKIKSRLQCSDTQFHNN